MTFLHNFAHNSKLILLQRASLAGVGSQMDIRLISSLFSYYQISTSLLRWRSVRTSLHMYVLGFALFSPVTQQCYSVVLTFLSFAFSAFSSFSHFLDILFKSLAANFSWNKCSVFSKLRNLNFSSQSIKSNLHVTPQG